MAELEILPDSRARTVKGSIKGPWGYWLPIFCANCGAEGGYVPEENMTFAFYLCRNCEHLGSTANMMAEPDVAFWNRVNKEQMDKYNRLLSQKELQKVVEDSSTPLSTLLAEGPSPRGK